MATPTPAPPLPPGPQDFKITQDKTRLVLTWSEVPDKVLGYYIFFSEDAFKNYHRINSAPFTGTTAKIPKAKLKKGRPYYFVVRAAALPDGKDGKASLVFKITVR